MPEGESFWPYGARLAVTVSMQFEAGGQPISGASDPIAEPVAEDAVTGQVSMDYGVVLMCHSTRSGKE